MQPQFLYALGTKSAVFCCETWLSCRRVRSLLKSGYVLVDRMTRRNLKNQEAEVRYARAWLDLTGS